MTKTKKEVSRNIPETDIEIFKDVLTRIISNLENV